MAQMVLHWTSVALRERKEVERPLVTVDRLPGLARTDRDHLRQVELEARRVTEHLADGAEHERMHDDVTAGSRACDESAGPPRAPAGEVVGSERRRVEVRLELRARRSSTAGATARSTIA